MLLKLADERSTDGLMHQFMHSPMLNMTESPLKGAAKLPVVDIRLKQSVQHHNFLTASIITLPPEKKKNSTTMAFP